VQCCRDRFGRGPTDARAYVGRDYALVILASAQTEVERSLVAEGELDSRTVTPSPFLRAGQREGPLHDVELRPALLRLKDRRLPLPGQIREKDSHGTIREALPASLARPFARRL
jgi:hypothetical protein